MVLMWAAVWGLTNWKHDAEHEHNTDSRRSPLHCGYILRLDYNAICIVGVYCDWAYNANCIVGVYCDWVYYANSCSTCIVGVLPIGFITRITLWERQTCWRWSPWHCGWLMRYVLWVFPETTTTVTLASVSGRLQPCLCSVTRVACVEKANVWKTIAILIT